MLRRLLPGGLRAQLAIVIAAVMALSVGASFLAVYSVTGSRLRSQIDAQLRTQVSEWQQFTARADLSDSGRARAGGNTIHRCPAIPRGVAADRGPSRRRAHRE